MKKTARKKKVVLEVSEKPKPPIVAEIEPVLDKQKGMKKLFANKPFFIGSIVVLLIVIAAGVVYAISYFAEDAVPQASSPSTEEVQKILDEVGEIVVLPQGETPTIATVTDIEKLSSQPFFKDAQNGDRVIIFGTARQAILYRPGIKKIITMSPIDANSLPQAQTGNQASASAQAQNNNITPTPKEKVKVAVFNSTKEAGLARRGAELLSQDVFEVVSTLNATGEYKTTSVSIINRNAVRDSDIKAISDSYKKISVSNNPLPADEAAPAGADIVVILGSDFSEEY